MRKIFVILLIVPVILASFLLSEKFTTSTNAVVTPELKNQIRKLPDSDISTQDIPAWIVTLHDIEAVSHGGYNQSKDSKIITDMNVVINANTGEEVEGFSYK